MNISKYHYQLIAFPIFLMVVVFVLWASLMRVDEFVRGFGKIVPAGQVKRIQHLEGGIVSEILVKEGDSVRAGQTVYKIRNDFAMANLGELQINMYSRLATEARLRAELSGADEIQFPSEIFEKVPNIIENEKKLFEQRRNNYKSNIDLLEEQADQRRSQLQEDRAKSKNLSLQYEYSKEQQQILERLVKSGAGSQKELIDSKLKAQNSLTDLDDVRNRMLTSEKGIRESQLKIEEAKNRHLVEVQTELSGVLLDMEKLKENISANMDRVSRTEITTPVDGVVKTLIYNTIGGIIKPGETIAEILPTNDTLVVEARVQPQDRARLWPGQKVNITVTAYDTAIHGKITGYITDVSADTFLDEGTRAPYYAVKIESSVAGFGGSKPLYPGMVAQVDIISGERTVMAYFLKPILKVFSASLSEP